MEFLGLIINSLSMSLSLSKDRGVMSLNASCKKMLSKTRSSLREIVRVMGNFSGALPAVPFARAHYRNLQFLKNTNLKLATEFDRKIKTFQMALSQTLIDGFLRLQTLIASP